jgi:hypothetical protein
MPWKKPATSDHVECLKWSHGNTKYEIFISILDNLELMFLLPHCLDAKEKIEQVVSDAHLGQALFRAFPRTASTVLRTIWDIILQDQQPAESEAAFDSCLRSFIDSHSTTNDRHDPINQLHQAHKPREILVQNFFYRLREVNGCVRWLPGNEQELNQDQLKQALFDSMPFTWRERFEQAGQSNSCWRR